MGRFGALFKKGDDKQAPTAPATSNPYAQQPPAASATSNPYAQQQPVAQYPSQSYDQYNANQYDSNQRIAPGPRGPSSGLPSGPRPGGLPSRVAPGPRTGDWGSNTSASPPYAAQPGDSPPPPYQGSPSLGSAGRSPALSSNQASPSLGSGYPKEKHGALDGIGSTRFGPGAPQPFGQSPAPPSQRQGGGYGSLDTEREESFSSSRYPSQRPAQAYGSNDSQQDFAAPMTEEDEADGVKRQIEEQMMATNDLARSNLGRMRAGRQNLESMVQQLAVDSETFHNAEKNLDSTSMPGSSSQTLLLQSLT